VLIVKLITFRASDFKMVIAYSSIVHMGLGFLGFFYLKNNSFFGIIILCLGHGFVRRGLFQLFNKIYLKSNSRKVGLNKGVKLLSPIISFKLFLLLIFNSSFPMSLSFFSELKFSIILIRFRQINLIIIILSIFLVGLFKIYFFLKLSQGKKIISLKK